MELSKPRAPRYASLDMWRGVACLMVLVNHAVSFRGAALPSDGLIQHLNVAISAVSKRMWIGVPIFFVISGYCITATLDAHGRRKHSVATYFLKRFRRIFPPYWAVLVTTAGIVAVFDVLFSGAISRGGLFRPWWFTASQWFGSLTLTEFWRPHIFGSPKALFLGHAWTLCYEEQFYAVSGVLLVLCPRRLFLGAAGVTAGVVLAIFAAARLNWAIDGFFFDGGWIQFSLGILLYYVLNYGGAIARRVGVSIFVGLILGCLSYWPALFGPEATQAQIASSPTSFLVAAVFALVALSIHRFDAAIVGSPKLRWLRSCGLMCYSLYLVHLPLVMLILTGFRAAGFAPKALSPFISLPVCAIPALWLSWQFHVTVERRFMSARAPDRRPILAEQPALA
jgi:peptidoglycan/LPS O-acetylase OafA/YrhL